MWTTITREEIIAKIRKVEALFGGSGFADEMNAAASALERHNAALLACASTTSIPTREGGTDGSGADSLETP